MDLHKKFSKISKKIQTCKDQLEDLHPSISLYQFRHQVPQISINICESKTLKNFNGRVYSICWGGFGSSKNPEASNMLLSGTDQGELSIWNIAKSKIIHKANIYSEDPWLMCCAFEQSEGSLIAAGGMEGRLHLFKLLKKSSLFSISEHPVISIKAHENYISSCKFLTSIDLLTSSGDSTITQWPIEATPTPIRVFAGHREDVLALSTTASNPSIFLSGSCDSYCKLWDIRSKNSTVWDCFWGEGHVNSVKFLPDSEFTFVAGNSESGIKVFDVRMVREVVWLDRGNCVTDVESSKSGRVLFAGDESGKVKVWDVFDQRVPVQVLNIEGEQISSIALAPAGNVLCCSSLEGGISVLRSEELGASS